MNLRSIALLLAGTSAVCSAIVTVAACSSDGTGELPPVSATGAPDATVGNKPSNSPSNETGIDGSTTPAVADAGPDCGDPKKYPRLRPSPDAGVYCPFQARTETDAAAGPCDIGEHCCIYPQRSGKASTCNAADTACETVEGNADFACSESADCTNGSVCCFAGQPEVDSVCPGKNFARGAKGSQCRTACAAGEHQLCSKQEDCPTGTTCTPFSVKSVDMGFCL